MWDFFKLKFIWSNNRFCLADSISTNHVLPWNRHWQIYRRKSLFGIKYLWRRRSQKGCNVAPLTMFFQTIFSEHFQTTRSNQRSGRAKALRVHFPAHSRSEKRREKVCWERFLHEIPSRHSKQAETVFAAAEIWEPKLLQQWLTESEGERSSEFRWNLFQLQLWRKVDESSGVSSQQAAL